MAWADLSSKPASSLWNWRTPRAWRNHLLQDKCLLDLCMLYTYVGYLERTRKVQVVRQMH